MIDLGADGIYVWDVNCVQTFTSGTTSCFAPPINAIGGFNATSSPDIVPVGGNNCTYTKVAGYLVCAQPYTSSICLNNVCKVVLINSIVEVFDDYYLANLTVGAGFIGYGVASEMWSGLIDPYTNTASYSVQLTQFEVPASTINLGVTNN